MNQSGSMFMGKRQHRLETTLGGDSGGATLCPKGKPHGCHTMDGIAGSGLQHPALGVAALGHMTLSCSMFERL